MTENSSPARFSKPLALVIGLLLLWIIIGITAAQWRMSPTFDEQNHVTRGIAILRTGDYRLIFHHPPLANIIEGLPVAWQHNGFSTKVSEWREAANPAMIWPMAQRTIWSPGVDGVSLIRHARLTVLLFTLLLAGVIFLWSRELFGNWGGVISLTLFAFDPAMLAHGGLATTDMAATATIALALYLLRRYLRSRSRVNLLWAGIGVGLAFAVKFTSLLLIPIAGFLLLWEAFSPAKPASSDNSSAPAVPLRLWKLISAGLLMLLVAGLFLWGSYGFKIEAYGSKPGQPVAANASFKERLPIPALQYLRGIKAVSSEAEGHHAYLLGKVDNTGKGWWYYFPLAVAVKTPVSALLLLLGMLLLLATPVGRKLLSLPKGELRYLLLPVGIYLLAALGLLGISLNLGIRHVLPIFPFLYILLGGWVLLWRQRFGRYLLFSLLILQLFSVVTSFPNFIGFFNQPAQLYAPGYKFLIDSNIDWGQDLPALAKVQKEKKLYPLSLSYFGTTPASAYNIECTPAAGFGIMASAPPPDWKNSHGYLAISVTNLMGGKSYSGEDYLFLLRQKPYATAGRSILIYRLPPGNKEK